MLKNRPEGLGYNRCNSGTAGDCVRYQLIRRWLLVLGVLMLLGLRPSALPGPLVLPLKSAITANQQASPRLALEALEQAIQFAPQIGSLQRAAARLALQSANLEQAAHFINLASRQVPPDPALHCLEGDLANARGNILEALAAWSLSSVDCDEPEINLARIANARLSAGDPAGLRLFLEALLDYQPDHAEASRQLALLLAAVDPPAASPALQRAGELQPQEAAFLRRLSQRISDARRLDYPAAVFAESGKTLAAAGHWQHAELALEKAILLVPSFIEARAYLGMIQIKLGKDGMPNLRLAAEEENAIAHALLGSHLLENGEEIQAILWLERASRLDPTNPVYAAQLGAALAAAGRMNAAEQSYRRAAELDAARPEFWLLLAKFSAENNLGIIETALPAARNAYLLGRGSSALDLLGYSHFQLGELILARRLLSAALSSNPLDPSLQYHWGLLQLENGDRQSAIAALQLALQLQPDAALAFRIQRTLDRLDSGGSFPPDRQSDRVLTQWR